MNMSTTLIIAVLLTLSSAAYLLGRKRAVRVAGGKQGIKDLHSLPAHYGALTAMWCGIPALLILGCWLAFQDTFITSLVVSDLPEQIRSLPSDRLNLVVNDIKNLVSGNIISGDVDLAMIKAADHYRDLLSTSKAALAVVILVVAIAGALLILKMIKPQTRARNHVERFIKILLVFCSTIAIFTTIGIVLAVLYEAIRFFQAIPITEFLFGLEWSPQMAIRERPGGFFRRVRGHTGFCRYLDDFGHRHGNCGAHRPDVSHISCPNMPAQNLPGCGQLPNRSWRFWPAFPRWFTAFLPH
jgi:phosphate transport system permease protein